MMRIGTGLAVLAASAALATAAVAQQINGAGATFPAPVYTKWGEAAKDKLNLALNYQAIGSGGGINQISNRTVDFGATDAPLTAEKLKAGNLMQFPAVMGAIVLTVNLPDIKDQELKLTGDLVADLYLGKIERWNDKRIAELNPGLKLPTARVAPVYRADASGTTYQFASYLAEVSPEWKQKVGAGTSVSWPTGVGARGNDGVASGVKNTRGAIGYVEYVYAKLNNLVVTQVKNKDGHFVSPTIEGFQAAAASADWKSDPTFGISLLNQPGKDSWPIVAPTFILVPTNPTNPEATKNVLRFFEWSFANGDKIAADLAYVPIPKAVTETVRSAWASNLKDANGKPLWGAR